MNKDELQDKRPAQTWLYDTVILNFGLPGMALAIYVILCQHTNKHSNTVFPSHKRIAELAQCSVKTVKRQLATLQEKGLITITPHYEDKTGRQTSNTYTLTPYPDLTPRSNLTPSHQGPTNNNHNKEQNNGTKKERTRVGARVHAPNGATLSLSNADKDSTTNGEKELPPGPKQAPSKEKARYDAVWNPSLMQKAIAAVWPCYPLGSHKIVQLEAMLLGRVGPHKGDRTYHDCMIRDSETGDIIGLNPTQVREWGAWWQARNPGKFIQRSCSWPSDIQASIMQWLAEQQAAAVRLEENPYPDGQLITPDVSVNGVYS